MADDNTIIEGTVKFRDGKKWKSRWCVMRKLSPVADCVQLQVWRDARARCTAGAGGEEAGCKAGCKAALSLQRYLGHEAGFTLDKHSNTLALLCRDLTVLLAFDTRERLMQWQVKVQVHLGASREYLVQVCGGGGAGGGGRRGKVPAGPARLHVTRRRASLVAGSPPKLLAVWELQHLRRYGVVEGRFCLEGGSRCAVGDAGGAGGAGEGLHVLLSDEARDIARAFDLAVLGQLDQRIHAKSLADSPRSHKSYRPDTRLAELQLTAQTTQGVQAAQRNGEGREAERWPSSEELGDAASVCGGGGGGGAGGEDAALSRCRSCMSKLGQLSRSSTAALSRSSTAALTPGARHFSPNWTMEGLSDVTSTLPRSVSSECRCVSPGSPPGAPPPPPRPPRLDLRKPPAPLPGHARRTPGDVGPYENYDVPRLPSSEVDGEYYDTPKRLKECLNEESSRSTKSSTANALILKKPCGCLLKFGRRRRDRSPTATVVEALPLAPAPAACPCRRLTAWWSGVLPSPAAPSTPAAPGKENLRPGAGGGGEHSALYATVDVSRKTSRRPARGDLAPDYENLSFALSLQHYENASHVLRRAGLTRAELDALATSLRRPPAAASHYLVMQPNTHEPACSGYTPMSPVSGLAFHTLDRPPRPARPSGLVDEKSASNPALCDVHCAGAAAAAGRRVRADVHAAGAGPRGEVRVRSSSADSSRFLEDVEECGGSGCSVDTLLPPAELQRERRADGGGEGGGGGAASAAPCRDSSSSNDSGVSVCSARRNSPPPARVPPRVSPRAAPRRRARSTDERGGGREPVPAKSSSAEAEVPLLTGKPLIRNGGGGGGGVADSRSTSSAGTSDMSDYIETLSLCSSHSSNAEAHAPLATRVVRHTTSTLRPRSGKEYLSLGGGGAAGDGVGSGHTDG